MAAPLLASFALVSAALPPAAPLDQLFQDHKIEVPSLSLGPKNFGDGPQRALPPAADLPTFISPAIPPANKRKIPEVQSAMPVLKAPLLDPKMVHAPKDKDTDFKLIVKEVKVADGK